NKALLNSRAVFLIQKMFKFDDTIAAISTPPGSGGIAVVRVSGSDSIKIVDQIFSGKVALTNAQSHKVYRGFIIEHDKTGKEEIVDEVLVTVFRKPHSYTGEDVVEISCHGGHYLSHKILQLVLQKGARLAEPGEFTQRAFLNGRMDLSQAEAVADIIKAKTERSLKVALSQFQGQLSKKIKYLREILIEICSLLELELDFAEEDVEFADRKTIQEKMNTIVETIKKILATYERGRILREGAKLVIVGKPNVGKSSLLNALLKEDRAIVTEIPGTTRDVLEEQLDIRGTLFRVVDTAGIRKSKDLIEQEGIRRTEKQIKEADVIVHMFDGSRDLDQQDAEIFKQIQSLKPDRQNGYLGVINKIDLPRVLTASELKQLIGHQSKIVEISAKELTGFDSFEETLLECISNKDVDFQEEVLITNIRHKNALENALEAINRAMKSLQNGYSSEFVAVDLRAALNYLGEIIGEVTTEDILGHIFSNFCIGK
ncbi:MAG: tRNA uridine-5-carboxymethylaminomethyl(34) synthesis GTPase MnmE, partial [Calditrichaeota bacterium]